jgi:hypothetical protein
MVVGAMLEFLAGIFFWGGRRHLPQFAICYTLGNLCSVGASGFFVGPKKLVKVRRLSLHATDSVTADDGPHASERC